MAYKLKGVVEADETYVGGKAKGVRVRGAKKKTPVERYVKGFDFRYNARNMSDAKRIICAIEGTKGKRLFYKK